MMHDILFYIFIFQNSILAVTGIIFIFLSVDEELNTIIIAYIWLLDISSTADIRNHDMYFMCLSRESHSSFKIFFERLASKSWWSKLGK